MRLDPVRQALLAEARDDAAARRAAARADVASAVQAARDQADAMLAAARTEGEAEAASVAATELARARRHAREQVLAARRDTDERARAAVRRAASELRHDPTYPMLVESLAELVRHQLGASATVTADEHVGGVVGRAGTRSVDYRLPVVAERWFDARGRDGDEP